MNRLVCKIHADSYDPGTYVDEGCIPEYGTLAYMSITAVGTQTDEEFRFIQINEGTYDTEPNMILMFNGALKIDYHDIGLYDFYYDGLKVFVYKNGVEERTLSDFDPYYFIIGIHGGIKLFGYSTIPVSGFRVEIVDSFP